MTRYLLASAICVSLVSAPMALAGGKGGTEIGLASYNDIGFVASKGLPLNIDFLRANGIQTYGELEFGAGFGNGVAVGAELAGGMLFGLGTGLSIYGGLGPALGFKDEVEFGLGIEVGLNIDVNDSHMFFEAGSHPASNYFAVGLSF